MEVKKQTTKKPKTPDIQGSIVGYVHNKIYLYHYYDDDDDAAAAADDDDD